MVEGHRITALHFIRRGVVRVRSHADSILMQDSMFSPVRPIYVMIEWSTACALWLLPLLSTLHT
eukprot:3945155-Pleurochrysis_carterae.AAC.1